VEIYKKAYPHLEEQAERIYELLEKEENQFRQTIKRGTHELEKLLDRGTQLDGKIAFDLYQTYGFPLEMILEEMGIQLKASDDIVSQFKQEQETHSANSRAGAEAKFKGGLADNSEQVTRLHTAHHLLLAALRKVLGDHVHQKGSNITGERLRIDFSHPDKVTPEQLTEVEKIVNEWIDQALPVQQVMLPREEAETVGAEMEFGQKYPDTVSVYFIGGESNGKIPTGWISSEFCGGPHVVNTSDLAFGGKRFRILKEESSSSGVRRIKANLE
jgi:alanyl-tRNA synthetase